jgi:hypothetical protein
MQKKRVAILIVFLALTTTACLATSASQTQSITSAPAQASDVVFKTPEEAITSYLEGVTQNDIQKITQACAINEMSEKFRFDLYTERLGGLFLPAQSLSPTNYPFYVETNKMQLSAQIFNQVKIFTFSLLSNEQVSDGSPITGMDAQRTNSFMKDVDPKRLSSLVVKKIGLPNKPLMNNSKYLDNAAKIALVYGADESTERVVLFSFEQKTYFLGFTLLRYGENWKISSPTSALAGTSALGAPQKTTEGDFENLINGN